MPTTHLRHLAVYVDEPEPNNFYWVMIESHDDLTAWVEVDSASSGFLTWIDAHQAGNLALLARIDDRQSGPRVDGEDESASPVGQSKDDSAFRSVASTLSSGY